MAASLKQLPYPPRVPCRPPPGVIGSPLVSTTHFSVTRQQRCQARIAFWSVIKRRSLVPRSSSSSPSETDSEDSKSTEEEKRPFGYTRKDVLLIGLGVTLFGVGLKYGLEFVGVDPLQAGNVVQLVIVLGMTVGWISTYMFRVANKDMTYAQQLRDYEKQVMEKRLESLSEAELQALLEQVEEEKQRIGPIPTTTTTTNTITTTMASMATNSLFHLLSILTALVAAEAVTFTVTNKCTYTVWPAATPVGGGTKLDQGQSWTFDVPTGTASGRVWGRTGCSFDDSGRGTCTTGDCGGVLACTLSGRPPLTIAEFTLNRDNNQDYFDLSLIDGFNVPMNFLPDGDGAGCSKGGPRCSADVTAACPAQLKTQGGCNSACTVFNTDTYCCRGEFEQNCPPTDYSKFFKEQCPDAYSYAKDDQTSTFTCPVGTNYQIVFCP